MQYREHAIYSPRYRTIKHDSNGTMPHVHSIEIEGGLSAWPSLSDRRDDDSGACPSPLVPPYALLQAAHAPFSKRRALLFYSPSRARVAFCARRVALSSITRHSKKGNNHGIQQDRLHLSGRNRRFRSVLLRHVRGSRNYFAPLVQSSVV